MNTFQARPQDFNTTEWLEALEIFKANLYTQFGTNVVDVPDITKESEEWEPYTESMLIDDSILKNESQYCVLGVKGTRFLTQLRQS